MWDNAQRQVYERIISHVVMASIVKMIEDEMTEQEICEVLVGKGWASPAPRLRNLVRNAKVEVFRDTDGNAARLHIGE